MRRSHIRAAALAAAVLGLGLPARAQAAPLDLAGALSYALDRSPTILNKRANLANLESTFARDHANEFPAIAGTLSNQLQKSANALGQFSQYGIAPAAAFSQNTAQIGVSQWTIYNGSYSQMLAQQAKRQVEAARADLRRAQQQLAQDVTNAYYAITAKRENVRLDTVDLAYEQALLDVARNNERVGRAAGVDTLRAQVNLLRSQATLTTAQSDEATARESLAQTIGAAPDQPFIVVDVVPEPPLPTAPLANLIAIAQANRMDITGARASLAAARISNSLIDVDRYPTVQLNAAFGNQFSATQFGSALQQLNALPPGQAPAGLALARGNPGFWQIGATETLQIGFIDYGARRASHRAAKIGIDAAETTLATTQFAVETDVRQAVRGAQTTAANLATAKQASVVATEAARISQLQYKNGLISLTDATQTERDNVAAQNDLVNARVAYVGAIVHLRVVLGTSDPLAIVDLRTP